MAIPASLRPAGTLIRTGKSPAGIAANAELFVDIAILSVRRFRYPGTGYYGGYPWGYVAIPLLPSLALGARWLL
jgi:hypothetical protein